MKTTETKIGDACRNTSHGDPPLRSPHSIRRVHPGSANTMPLVRATCAMSVATAAAPRARRRASMTQARAMTKDPIGTLPSRTVARSRSVVRCSAGKDQQSEFVPWTTPERLTLAAGWLALGSTAVFVAPTGTSGFDTELITSLISSPFSGAVNPLFESLFNSLGVVPAVYAALLLPGGKDQPRLPPVPPIGLSFALGFFALGPYLILREPRDEEGSIQKSDLGWATANIFENKIFAAVNTLFATFLIGYAATHCDASTIEGFKLLWTEQSALCCVSSCDLLVLSLAMFGVISEDQKRRGVFSSASAAAFSAVPVLGPCVWLLVRPTLEE